ncbi:MAG: hypothetical protein IK000_05065 [Bacteroidaceae bacterium]|nr:hypothetical protein [Bacteroidaceae bacterium]
MKKVCLLVLLVIACLPAKAQFNLGLRVGTTAFYGKLATERSDAYTLGPQVQLGLTSDLAVNVSVLYKTSQLSNLKRTDLKNGCLALPLNLMWIVSEGRDNYTFFQFGPQADISLRDTRTCFRTRDFSSFYTDVSLNCGVGIRFCTFLQATIDWHLPIGSTNDWDWSRLSDGNYYKHSVMNVSLAFML